MPSVKSNKTKLWILPVIVLAQFAGTSLWFAGNAILPGLPAIGYKPEMLGHITSAVQLGFICGTFLFALLNLSDRFSPSKLFFICSLAGALANSLLCFLPLTISTILGLRFITGLFLAGIYPVGMKIAADWHEKGLGKALGFLVGALVLGTAFPHLLKTFFQTLPWTYVLLFTSVFAALGGLVLWLLVPDGPFRKQNKVLNLKAAFQVFQNKTFRNVAFGYFGHMWELYTFWALMPVLLLHYNQQYNPKQISTWSFVIIALGSVACAAGGYFSHRLGSRWVAFAALLCSFLCCILSPFSFQLPHVLFILFLIFWGMVVIADSPQFSALIAQTAPPEITGTALTIVNGLGFTITIISLQVITKLSLFINPDYVYIYLGLGPALGLLTLFKSGKLSKARNH